MDVNSSLPLNLRFWKLTRLDPTRRATNLLYSSSDAKVEILNPLALLGFKLPVGENIRKVSFCYTKIPQGLPTPYVGKSYKTDPSPSAGQGNCWANDVVE